jgi:hypothetical protein
VDVDGLWTLAGAYGFPEGDLFASDPVYERGLERLAALFQQFEIPAAFFWIGRDLDLAAKREVARSLARDGHEAANHAWSHCLDLEDQPDEILEREIVGTNRVIEEATGCRPVGFRAPGYAAGERVWTAASRAGLRYDGSLLPTRWGGLLRWLAGRLRARVRRELPPDAERPAHRSARQYGSGGGLEPDWFRPREGGRPLLRLPLAVSPLLRLPLHASLGMLLGAPATVAGLRRLARRGAPVTCLLHGLDAVGAEELEGRLPAALLRTRAFQIRLGDKLAFLRALLRAMKQHTDVQPTADWVARQQPPEDLAHHDG